MRDVDHLVRAFSRELERLPGVGAVETAPMSGNADSAVRLRVRDEPVRLIVEARHAVYPGDVAGLAERLRGALDGCGGVQRDDSAPPAHAVVLAPLVSPGAREQLRSRGIGYWDQSGSLYLVLPHAVFFIDRRTPPAGDRTYKQLFHGAGTAVLHVMLLDPHRTWHGNELADVASVSTYTVHRVLETLQQREWVAASGASRHRTRRLVAPAAVLDAWAEAHSLHAYDVSRFHRWSRTFGQLRSGLAADLDAINIPYALTLDAGAQLVAPHMSSVDRVAILVPPRTDLEQLAITARMSPVDDGENVVVMRPKHTAPLIGRERIDEVWVASPVQLYLDLTASPRRGREQARHLRAEKLTF